MKRDNEVMVLFGHFKPRFFIIIGAILLASFLVYLYSSSSTSNRQNSNYNNPTTSTPTTSKDWDISLSYYNNSVVGDGISIVSIPFTILSGIEQPITVPIQVQAITNVGSVTTKCAAPSVCNATFQAPKTAKTEYANISINVGGTAGGVTKTISIEVTPDMLRSIQMYANISTGDYARLPSNFTLNGNINQQSEYFSGYGVYYGDPTPVPIYIYASDNRGNSFPDSAKLNFSTTPQGAGTLSNSTCNTTQGDCTIYYTPSFKNKLFQNATITANSDGITSSLTINFVAKSLSLTVNNEPPQSNCTATYNNPCFYSGDMLLSALLTGANSFPIPNEKVLFGIYATTLVNGGKIQAENGTVVTNNPDVACTTDSSGTCSTLIHVENASVYHITAQADVVTSYNSIV